jgi:hypothetical protein
LTGGIQMEVVKQESRKNFRRQLEGLVFKVYCEDNGK